MGCAYSALFFGPLAAILIGVEAGTGDVSAGVFRDLVVTGRSRVALFSSRVPAALALCWTVMPLATCCCCWARSPSPPTCPPPAGLLVEGLGFILLATGVLCVVAVGFASLTASKPASIMALIGWQLVASPLIASIGSLGSLRDGVLSQALVHFGPVHVGDGNATVAMSGATATIVLAAWLALFLALGAWRTQTMDA